MGSVKEQFTSRCVLDASVKNNFQFDNISDVLYINDGSYLYS